MKDLVVLLLVPLFCCSLVLPKHNEQHFDVIVIGAGPSGIAAARELRKAEVNYVVLEGRPRIGGRIENRTVDGAQVDVGASWMHKFHGNPKHPFVKLVEELGIN